MSRIDLPARPSLDSLRKQAKKLTRDAAVGNDESLARIRAQLPRATLPLSHRDAQLVIAREYGFAGWKDLTAEVQKRLGGGLEWAAAQAKVAIHDQDHERLRALLAEYPALVTWRDARGETLASAVTPYALDCRDPERERLYTRPLAAEMLIDAGLTIERDTWEYLIAVGASGMLHLLAHKHVLPQTVPVLAALGDETAIRAWLEQSHRPEDSEGLDERTVIGRGLLNACRFKHNGIASLLLERAIALEPDLGRRIDRWQGRQAFLELLTEHQAGYDNRDRTPWEVVVIRQLQRAVDAGDMAAFRRWLDEEPWLLQSPYVRVQAGLIHQASEKKERESFIMALLERDPALLYTAPPPGSSAVVTALSYGNAHLVPLLTRIWPRPDDLPHAAGTGDFTAVRKWFDAAGTPALGSLSHHYPGNDPQFKGADLGWDSVTAQQVLDVALAWAVLNRHFEIAEFLLAHGADVNTNWATHEPASVLHEAAIQGHEAAVRFLIDHGADLSMKDYRYQSTAEGWARYGSRDERMAELLAAARRARGEAPPIS